jgi:hypothetical protein
LKSFQDRDVDFTVYQKDSGVDAYLNHTRPAGETQMSAALRTDRRGPLF